MPMSRSFAHRLLPNLSRIVQHFGTPFHIYDADGIVDGGKALNRAFGRVDGFKEFYAVKANPNITLLRLLHRFGFGFDCSSAPELFLARLASARPDEIMFTSNNTSQEEFAAAAAAGGCILNLDDISLVSKVPKFPELICFRFNPGSCRTGNAIIGNPGEAKYGVTHDQITDAYRLARECGAKRFGLHTMVCSNSLEYTYMVETVRSLLAVVRMVSDALGIEFEFINMGGGLGIPYKPDDQPLPIEKMAAEIAELLSAFKVERGYCPKLLMESGRWITGPHGVLVTTCINRKDTYKQFRGVDAACISTMMRPAIYYPDGGWHNITVHGQDGQEKTGEMELVNIVGPACENNDQFGHDRLLPKIAEGDFAIMHDAGAHCLPMTSQYNGRLRPKELLMSGNYVELIRRAETLEDYLATLNFTPDTMMM